MSEESSEIDQNQPQNSNGIGKITCHLVSLPKVLLHRIDEQTIASFKKSTMSPKKPVKRLASKPSRFSPPQSPVGKVSERNNVKTPNKSLKKENNFAFKSAKQQKKIIGGKLEAVSKAVSKGSSKDLIKPNSSPVKNMLNKTMLQKKSKIAIPPPKRSKSMSKSPKPTPPKPKATTPIKSVKKSMTPKIKIDTSQAKTVANSGDESLYDDLMNQIESTHNKRNEVLSRTEKTTNITLKPNAGNKPPTVVKGGIIKKTNLPEDLKPVTTPNNLNKVSKDISSTPKETSKSTSTRKNIKPPNKSLSPTPAKKPSPWPIAISSPFKDSPQTNPIKPTKKPGPKSKINSNAAEDLTPKLSQKTSKPIVPSPPSNLQSSSQMDAKPISFNAGKPRIGPKKTATVIPQLKSADVDDNLSDEYTEEERLEMDIDPVETIKMSNTPSKSANQDLKKENLLNKPNPSSYDSSKDDEDPHLDLLRILTDESEEPAQVPAPQSTNQPISKPSPVKAADSITAVEETNNEDSMDSSIIDQVNEPSANGDVEPPVRTIYDLMNEISLQYPSWNLHIMPESNAFCIAQVTKGRLGLPTLKKCIELDPNDYNAKVYIHQYHIKRFDGVYDSEESIVALIEEINSIKA